MEQSDPRSYTVQVQNGTIRRNRRDLIVLPDPQESVSPEEQNSEGNGQEQIQNDRNSDATTPRLELKKLEVAECLNRLRDLSRTGFKEGDVVVCTFRC